MAILIDTKLFQCSCGCLEFKVETIKSFMIGQKVGDQTLLAENTARKTLVCETCGKKHDVKQLNLVIKETEE